MRVERIGDCTLYLGDCRAVLPHIESHAAMLADTPYGMAHRSDGGPRGNTAWEGREVAIVGDTDTTVRDWLLSWVRKRDMAALFFGTPKVPRPEGVALTLVWDKGPGAGALGNLDIPWKATWEEIYVIGSTGFCGRRDEAVIRGPGQFQGDRLHPHEKPVWLGQYLASKLAADTVIVPTMGCGSEVLGALQAGKKVIGIELDETWFDLAYQRVADLHAKPRQMALLPQ